MNKLRIYKPEHWELMWFIGSLTFLLFLLIPEFLNSDSYNKHPVLFSSLIGLSTCVITAIIVLYLQRLYRNKKLLNYYLKISGEYIRTDIGQDNTPTERLADIKKQNIGLIIVLSYQSENSFCVDISYWKDDIACSRRSLLSRRMNFGAKK